MLLSRIRLSMALLALIIGIWLITTKETGIASLFLIVAILLSAVHILFNNVSAAFIALKKGDINEAEILIHSIQKPEWLLKQHKAYYHFTKGMIANQRKRSTEAIDELKAALAIGLRTPNDNALAAINIAHTAYNDKDLSTSKEFMLKAKALNSDDLMIKEHIKKLEEVLGSK